MSIDALKPSPALLSKLGSIIMHVDEGAGKDGHVFDVLTFQKLLEDAEVRAWLSAMDSMALLPKKR